MILVLFLIVEVILLRIMMVGILLFLPLPVLRIVVVLRLPVHQVKLELHIVFVRLFLSRARKKLKNNLRKQFIKRWENPMKTVINIV
jgi:hypothetical protein